MKEHRLIYKGPDRPEGKGRKKFERFASDMDKAFGEIERGEKDRNNIGAEMAEEMRKGEYTKLPKGINDRKIEAAVNGMIDKVQINFTNGEDPASIVLQAERKLTKAIVTALGIKGNNLKFKVPAIIEKLYGDNIRRTYRESIQQAIATKQRQYFNINIALGRNRKRELISEFIEANKDN